MDSSFPAHLVPDHGAPGLAVAHAVAADPGAAPLLRYLGLRAEGLQALAYSPPTGFAPRALDCHLNVWGQVRQAGGRPQHGWLVYDESAVGGGLEAIFHTVWRAPDGTLHDVTPRADGTPWLWFAPDARRRIVLAEHDGQPAIRTWANVRLQGTRVVAPLRRLEIVLDPAFATALGLWPW